MKRFLVPALAACAFAAATHAADRGDTAFVVTYVCDGGRYLAVGYPAYADARRAPIRLTWEGRTVLLGPSRMIGSGARYINSLANLEWWSKGNGGTLSRPSDNRPLLTNCVES